MQIVVHKTFYSIGTGRRGFTPLFQNIFQKTKRAPFLTGRRRSSKSRTKQSANKKTAESNRRNYPVRIEHKNVHVKSGFVRRLVAQSKRLSPLARLEIVVFNLNQDFSLEFILTHRTADVNMKIKLVYKFIQLHNQYKTNVRFVGGVHKNLQVYILKTCRLS